jgi:primosomal protein N' (replication factor Y)
VEADVYAYLNRAKLAGVKLNHPVEIFGVVPASLARRANYVRAQLLIQANSRRVLQQFLRVWQPGLADLASNKLRCSLDIDPLEF